MSTGWDWVEPIKFIGTAVVAGLGGFIGAYWSGYYKKKGENYATKEDAADILNQVKATTRATKEIESKFSGELWNKQKQWELKKEAVFNCAKALAQLEEALISVHALRQIEQKPGDINFATSEHDRIIGWSNVAKIFDQARLLIKITCSKETTEEIYKVGAAALAIAQPLCAGTDANAYKTGGREFMKNLVSAELTLRKELGTE